MKKFLLSLLMMPVLAQAGVGIAEDAGEFLLFV